MPASCHLYDQLEIAAMRRQPVKITTIDDQTIKLTIADLFAKEGVEYLATTEGKMIDLETISEFEILSDQK